MDRLGTARCGEERHGRARQGRARHGWAWHGNKTKEWWYEMKDKKGKDETTSEKTDEVRIAKPNFTIMKVPIIGLTPYVGHRFGEIAAENIRLLVTGENKGKPKKNRNFDAEYEECFYKDAEGKFCIPGAAFKQAIVDEGKNQFSVGNKNISGAMIGKNIHVLEKLCVLKYSKVERTVDYPRQSGRTGAPDIRHRPYFYDWKTVITVRFDADIFSKEVILNLIQRAGMTQGVGDWRPGAPKSPGGQNGMWEIGQTNKE